MRRCTSAGLLSAVWLCPVQARSDEGGAPRKHPIEELFLGEVAFPQDRFELQITSAPQWQRDGRRVSYRVPLVLELGITERFQIAGELPLELVRHDQGVAGGIGSIRLGALASILDERALALSLGLEAGSPAIPRHGGPAAYTVEPFLSFDKALGPIHLSATASVELALLSVENGATEFGAGAHLGIYFSAGAVVPILEAAAELDEGAPVVLAPGILWHPLPDLELGAAALLGLTDAAPDAGLSLLATWEVELAGEDDELPGRKARAHTP